MKSVYFHEDDYCSIEILPEENLEFCLSQAGLIDEFSAAHKTEFGYTDVFLRGKEPCSLAEKMISKETIDEALRGVLPAIDDIFTGYSTYRERCEDTFAFGYDNNVVIFYEVKDGIVEHIWLNLLIRESDDIVRAKKVFSSLSKVGNFIVADWGWSYIEKLDNSESLGQYLYNRLEVFGAKQ